MKMYEAYLNTFSVEINEIEVISFTEKTYTVEKNFFGKIRKDRNNRFSDYRGVFETKEQAKEYALELLNSRISREENRVDHSKKMIAIYADLIESLEAKS